jgi:hypothetical protein
MHHDNTMSDTSFFIRKLLTKNKVALVPQPLFSPDLAACDFSLKLSCRHFDTIEMIEAESLVDLNTLIENDFQNGFKNWRKCWEWCICTEGDYVEGDGDQYAKS